VNFLLSGENRRYAGKWVGVLDNYSERQVVVTGTRADIVRDLMRKDCASELRKGYCFSVAKIPSPGEKLEVALLWAGFEPQKCEPQLQQG
jgi:hypothetical protein